MVASTVAPKKLGHIVLRVRDLEASERFYTDVLGLHVNTKIPGMMTFMSASDDSSHELGLMAIRNPASFNGPQGIYHYAWQMESLEDLQAIYRHLKQSDVKIVGIGDHGISLGVYVMDPDGYQIEIFYELPRDRWPAEDIFSGSFPGSLE